MRNLFFLITTLGIFGCSTTVNLALQNTETYPLENVVKVYGKDGFQTQEIGIGLIDGGSSESKTFSVKNGGSFSVESNIPDSAIIFNSKKVTVSGKVDPFDKTVRVKNQYSRLDDTKSFETLSKSFKKLGDDIGAKPINLDNALQTRIGAIVVAIPAINDKPGKILYTITPTVLGVSQMKLEEVSIPHSNETEEITMSGKAAINASANLGPVGQFGMNWEKDSVYEMKWVLRGFGAVNKPEDAEKNPVKLFKAIHNDVKNHIVNLLNNNTDAKIFYINSFYVLDRAELFIKKGVKLSSGANSSSSIVALNAVYSFEKSQTQNKGYGPVVLNYWGDEYKLEKTGAVPSMPMPKSNGIMDAATNYILKPTGKKESLSF